MDLVSELGIVFNLLLMKRKIMKIEYFLFCIIIFFKCTLYESIEQKEKGKGSRNLDQIYNVYGAISISTEDDLPECDSSSQEFLFYIIELNEFQFCNGTDYEIIDLIGPAGLPGTDGADGADGTDGTDGISMTWLGSLAIEPVSPNLNNAYYNTVNRISYIWDGVSWQILAMDGDDSYADNLGNHTATQDINLDANKIIGEGGTEGISINSYGSVLIEGTYTGGNGTTPTSGQGSRLMWIPAKAAFRAGSVTGNQWDDSNIGAYSIAAGANSEASGSNSISLGNDNLASSSGAIAIGIGNTASENGSVAIGIENNAIGSISYAIGFENISSGSSSFAIGDQNTASGSSSFAIGKNNAASGDYSTAMGYRASSNGYSGSFIIGDKSTSTYVESDAPNQMMMRFDGGYKLFSNSAATIGVELVSAGNSWSILSDKNLKENFLPINHEVFLKKLQNLELFTWNYIGQNPQKQRHYGPTSQDFYRAFGHDHLGTIGNNKRIATADFLGVNFILIQALEKRSMKNKKFIEKIKAETNDGINKLKTENQLLKRRNIQLEARIENLEKKIEAILKNDSYVSTVNFE
jgi:hypothetical protein